MWAWMGALGISKFNGVVSPSYNVYRLTNKDEFVPEYLDYFYRSAPFICEIGRHSKGVWKSRLRLYPKSFLAMHSLKPPLPEQHEIVGYLANQVSPIESIVKTLRKSNRAQAD